MEDSDPPPQAPLADMDVNMGEADALPPGFVRRNPNVINLIDDDGNESDSTLLDNEIGPRVVPQISEARRKRRHTYTRNGHTYEVGRISKGNDGNFVRVTSIKRHCASGAIAIEHVQDNHRRLGTHSYDGRTLKPGKTVELSDSTFLRIVSILENRRTGEICVKGFRFQRNKFLKGHLEFKVNEVTLMTKHESNNVQHIAEQSMETIKLAAVVKIRELVLTNRPFPELSFLGIETGNFTSASAKEYVRANCRLTCRWVYCEDEGVLRRVTDIESDEGCSVPQANLRYNFRGQTTNQDKYTFMDGYSGAGGASSGAQLAGLLVERAFDHNLDTVATYRLNFPFAKCEAISAYDFIMSNENYRCDVLHLSPPCQPFSPAHTRPGPNDERNEATFLTTAELIKKTRPRIVTIEETFGLTRTQNNLDWFNATIQMFTKLGFSVRWKVFNLLDFGLPQPRKRLFIFASCPGEPLPAFPQPTHCPPSQTHRSPLPPFRTVRDAIARIPHNFSNHAPQFRSRFNKNPYPSDRPLAKTICCSGSVSYHPSGKRCFTTRELACLQGFPLEHRFGAREVRKQIGNALPPVVAKVSFGQVMRALRRADGG